MDVPLLVVMPLVAAIAGVALRQQSRAVFWLTASLLISLPGGAVIHTSHPADPPQRLVAFIAVFVFVPPLATLIMPRPFTRRAPPTTAWFLGVPLGFATFVLMLFLGTTVAVNVGLLHP